MLRFASRLLAWLGFALFVVLTKPADAWVETAVRGHRAEVVVHRDGRATVRHELELKVRGGPMKLLEIGGMGTNIEPLPDALVRRAAEGSAGLWPLAASSLEDGSLRLKIAAPRGLSGGNYLFSFGYTMDLGRENLISRSEDGYQVTWIGPRLPSGVDSARVTFVVPRVEKAPRLAPSTEGEGLAASVLLGEIRRGEREDEVDLVRTHLATGEPAVWRIWISEQALTEGSYAVQGEAASPAVSRRSFQKEHLWSQGAGRDALLSALIAGLFGLLLYFKARNVAHLAQLTDAREKPLILGRPWVRGGLGFVCVLFAVWLGLDQRPTLAMVLGALAAALGTFLLPVRRVRPRGPGRWVLIPPYPAPESPLPGALWETRSLPGFLACLSLVGAILFGAYRILPLSNYLALMTLGLSALLVPLFFTGGRRDFPQTPISQTRPWFDRLQRAFPADLLNVELWGREATLEKSTKTSYDEVRIRFVLHQPAHGLRAFEVAFEEAAGAHVMPCVVLRVLEDSWALSCLPKELPWQRGRTAEERVALLRPAAPTSAQLIRLLRSLAGTLRVPVGARPSTAHRSSGSGDLAAKGAMPAACPPM